MAYEKDKVFYNISISLEDQENIYDDDNDKEKTRIPFYTPFIEQKKDIDRSSALYSINALMQFFHADIADIRVFSKSAVDPKYALLCVDLFSLKVYVYLMKKRSNLARKLELFYQEIESKRENEKMRLQADLEFQQNEIKNLNKKYNVEMFTTKVRGGKAFAAEQKMRDLKNYFLEVNDYIKQQKLAESILKNNLKCCSKYE